MSSWHDVFAGLQAQVQSALSGLVPGEQIVIGYPPTVVLQNTGQLAATNQIFNGNNGPLVMIYDRGAATDVTRWMPRAVAQTPPPAPAVTYTVSQTFVPPNGTSTVTFDTGANADDAIGLSIYGRIETMAGVTYSAISAETSAVFASGFATAVNTTVPSLLSASVSGSQVTLTNVSGYAFNMQFASGNLGSELFEVHRTKRKAHIIMLANSPENLDTFGEPLSQALANLEITYGYELADTTWVQVINTGDLCIWNNALHNIFRRDWLLDLEYGVTLPLVEYPVLAFVPTWQVDSAV